MSVLNNATNLLLAADAASGGYQVSRSLRFNAPDSSYLSRTFGTATNQIKWTWAGWVKRTAFNYLPFLFSRGSVNTAGIVFCNSSFSSGDNILVGFGNASDNQWVTTTAVFRDPSAGFHLVVSADTANATAANRCKIWINNVEQAISGTISQNRTSWINENAIHNIGSNQGAPTDSAYVFNGYLAECFFIDGQALDPSSFTTTDLTTGQLIPKAYTGSYGTNGFKLNFSDNSTTAALGTDTSGNGNTWTVNNFQATVQTGRLYAQASGTATSAFSSATLLGNFPATVGGSYAIYDADLLTSTTSATFSYTYSFSGVVEVLVSADGTSWTSKGNQSSAYTTVTNASAFRYVRWFYSTFSFGINNNPAGNDSLVDSPTNYGTDTGVGGEVRGNYCTLNPLNTGATSLANGNLEVTTPSAGYGLTYSTIAISSGKWYWEVSPSSMTGNSEVGIAKAGGTLTNALGSYSLGYSYVNSALKGNNNSYTSYGASYTTNDIIGVALDLDAGTLVFYKNGSSQGTAFSSLSGEFFPAISDSSNSGGSTFVANFGQRAFAYTAPSGFKALCTQNLPAPLVTKSNTVMDVLLYTGTGASRSITGLNFNPDFVWIKPRSASEQHEVYDSVRGTSKVLFTDYTDGESTVANGITSFNSDGFSLGDRQYDNGSGITYVAWTWDAGTSTVTNNSGSISSQVRANPTAGFSVVTWTAGTGVYTVGHGLGVKPAMIIHKCRSNAEAWLVRHVSIGDSGWLILNSTAAASTLAYGGTNTSTVFYNQDGVTTSNGQTMVAYCFSPVVGYSSMGSYVGNGSSDGPFVYTGFRPRWILFKNTNTTNSWRIMDSSVNPYNVVSKGVYPNSSAAEDSYTNWQVDYLSNGFKVRSNSGEAEINGSGNTIIYAAFAESPFQYARAR